MDIRKQKPHRESVLPTQLRNGEAEFKPRPVGPEAELMTTRWQCLKIPPREVRDSSAVLDDQPSEQIENKQSKIRTPILVT